MGARGRDGWAAPAAALAGLAVTAAVLLVPPLRLAYRSGPAHLVLETAQAMTAGFVALLLLGRERRTRAVRDRLLARAMALLGVASLLVVAAGLDPHVAAGGPMTTWVPLALRLVAACVLAAAALVPAAARREPRPVRDAALLAGLVLAVVLGCLALEGQLPPVVVVQPPPERSGVPALHGHPLLLGAQLVGVACYAVAAAAFAGRGRREGDPLLGWLAASAAVGAWARVCYALYPSLYSEYVYAGDLLRLASTVLLLIGAAREVRGYWEERAADLAAAAERRRIARDLHDGAVQELGWARAQAMALAADPAPEHLARLVVSLERALDETRHALHALSGPAVPDLAASLRQVAGELESRHRRPVVVVGSTPGPAGTGARQAVVRVVREAVGNALRHADPQRVEVRLSERAVTVADDGSGFDPCASTQGYGLASMRDRAAGIGGRLEVSSGRSGTEVTLTW